MFQFCEIILLFNTAYILVCRKYCLSFILWILFFFHICFTTVYELQNEHKFMLDQYIYNTILYENVNILLVVVFTPCYRPVLKLITQFVFIGFINYTLSIKGKFRKLLCLICILLVNIQTNRSS